jgi:tyrosinase
MHNVSRRSFVAATAALPFVPWLEGRSATTAAHVRHGARSREGQEMLKIYAKGVEAMKNFKAGDPTGWLFQWYTHFVNGSTTKAAEISRIYPTSSSDRTLAEEVWDTCQAHSAGEDENNFLPWHRMFVLHFESIIRAVTHEDSFTLPYWNYSTSDKSTHGVIPPEFRKPNDPLFKSLYVANRNPGVNNGEPIDQGQPGDPLSLDSLAECPYEPVGSDPGFCAQLDNGLHGAVHVLVGGPENMGEIPYAANDPIFWMHHCNIDRLWASWSAGGRTAPSISGSFVFANKSGHRVVNDVADFLEISRLGYTYDALEPVPACPSTTTPNAALAAAGGQVRRHVATRAGTEVELKADAVRVTLEPVVPPPGAQAMSLRARVAEIPANRRLFLIVKDLRAQAQPHVLYHVYLEVPSDAAPDKMVQHHVGAVNFFNAVSHGMGGGGHGAPTKKAQQAPATQRTLRFDITNLAKKLQANGLLNDKPVVTIAPIGKPADSAKPVIGEISIVDE